MTSKYYRHISKKTSGNELSSILFHLEIDTMIIKEDWLKDIVHASKSKIMVKDSVFLGILTTDDENSKDWVCNKFFLYLNIMNPTIWF